MSFTSEEVRALILGAIKTRRGTFQLLDFLPSVAQSMGKDYQDAATAGLIIEVTWDLIREGVLVPSTAGGMGSSQGWPFLTATTFGKEVLAADGAVPHDRDGYVKALTAVAPLPPPALVYLDEALVAFGASAYIAAISMLGSVAEEALDPLVVAAAAWVGGRDGADLAATDPYKTTVRLDRLRAALVPRRKDLPQDLRHGLETNLTGIADLIRRARNEASHPSGRAFRRKDAFALFQLLPDYLGFVHRLTGWLTQNTAPAPP